MDDQTLYEIASQPTLGARIVAARSALGWSQAELQRRLNRHDLEEGGAGLLAQSTLSNWERDKFAPKRSYLWHLAVVTGVPEHVFRGEGRPVTGRQYESWGRFVETDLGMSMSEPERKTLASLDWAPELGAPTVEDWQQMLLMVRARSSRPGA